MFVKILYIVLFAVAFFYYFKISKGSGKPIKAEEVYQKIQNNESFFLLDVRTPEEYNRGHLPTAILLPNYEIKKSVQAKIPNKESCIVVYCQSGARSAHAEKILKSLGYKNIYDMGAISRWKHELEK